MLLSPHPRGLCPVSPPAAASAGSGDSSTLAEKCVAVCNSSSWLEALPLCKYRVYISGLISYYRSALEAAKHALSAAWMA